MKAGFRQRWRGSAAGRRKANVAAPQSRTVTGRPLPSSAALTLTGFVAPMLLDGPMNGECFLAWVEQMLAPTLQPGDIVIMDNLSDHKVTGIRDAIEAQDAQLLYLPP